MSNDRDIDQPEEQPPFRPEGRMQLIPATPPDAPVATQQSDVKAALTYIKKHHAADATQYVDYPEGENGGETSS